MRINESYRALFPNNCPVIEKDGDGKECGTCTFYLKDGVCPRHGRINQASQKARKSTDRQGIGAIVAQIKRVITRKKISAA